MDCPSCGHANGDAQKFCGECGAKLPPPGPVRCADCGAENPPGQKFCGECGKKLGDAPLAPRPVAAAVAMPPPPPRPSLAASLPRGERKVVTVLFADVSGFTAMSERLDPEEVTVIMNRCFSALGEPIDRHGGVIDKFIGDCVMALFGAPVAHEDDPERAVRAALEMQEALSALNARLPIPLAVNIGINSGMVVAGEVGTEGKRDYTVMGDAVNTAQRIQSAAKGGQVYVSESVFRPTRARFDFEELPPIVAKGKERPVPVFRLKGRRTEPAGPSRVGPGTPLVGREAEVARLGALLDAALAGRGSVAALSGEAGIGKTRLRSEATRRATEAGFAVAIGRGFDHRRGVPFGPLLEMVRRLFGVVDGDGGDEVRRKVEEGLPDLPLPAVDRAALAQDLIGGEEGVAAALDPGSRGARAVRQAPYLGLFRALAARGPALAVIEDLHWADAATLELLSHVADETAGRPLLLLLTGRPDAPFPRGVTVAPETIVLEELSPFDALRLLRHLAAGRPMDAELEEGILRRADGNPFFLEELVFSLGSVPAADAALPDTVQAVVAARIDRLGVEAKEVLQAASVLGRNFPLPLLEAVVGHGELSGTLARLEREALVYGRPGEVPPSWSFRQAITQEVAYGSLLRQAARPMHLAAARAIEATFRGRLEERYAELARHASLGGDLPASLDWGLAAAEADRRAFALASAEERYGGVLAGVTELAPDEAGGEAAPMAAGAAARRTTASFAIEAAARPSRARVDRWILGARLGRGEARRILGRWDEARADVEAALERARAAGERIGDCENALCRLAFLKGDFDEAHRRGEASRREAQACSDRRAEAGALNLLGNVADRQGRLDDARAFLAESAALFRQAGLVREEAWALADLGTALLHAGRLEESQAAQERSLEIKRGIDDRLGIAASLVNLGNLDSARREHLEASKRYQEALEISRAIGDRRGVAGTLTNLAAAEAELGRLSEAVGRLDEAVRIQTAIGNLPGRAEALLNRGATRMREGRFDVARDDFEEASRVFERMSYRLGIMIARANRAATLVEEGRSAEAIDDLGATLEFFRDVGLDDAILETESYLAAAEFALDAGSERLPALFARLERDQSAGAANVRARLRRLTGLPATPGL